MKKSKKVKLLLNKKMVSKLTQNTVKGGGESYTCPHTIGAVCTSTLPGSVLNCDNRPSVFGAGACTTVEIPN